MLNYCFEIQCFTLCVLPKSFWERKDYYSNPSYKASDAYVIVRLFMSFFQKMGLWQKSVVKSLTLSVYYFYIL